MAAMRSARCGGGGLAAAGLGVSGGEDCAVVGSVGCVGISLADSAACVRAGAGAIAASAGYEDGVVTATATLPFML